MIQGQSDPVRIIGDNCVGRFRVAIKIANNDDVALVRRGALEIEQVRRETIDGFVDSEATRLVLPQTVVERLGLPLAEELSVRYADGHTAQRRITEAVYLELAGRHGTFSAIVEPNRETALIGAIVLEDLDLLVDCPRQRVIPRDPSGAIYEVG